MTGISFILIIMQLNPLLGYESQQSVINALTVLPYYSLQSEFSGHYHWHAHHCRRHAHTRTFDNSDKELVGQGLGNIVAGLTGSLNFAPAVYLRLPHLLSAAILYACHQTAKATSWS
jgi:MFS superfamily sulfate permease-like transporter